MELAVNLAPRFRANLLTLANYVESLPRHYQHFDMRKFAAHYGDHYNSPTVRDFVENPRAYLQDCGTVACLAGHGPAAGFPVTESMVKTAEFGATSPHYNINWNKYTKKYFGIEVDDDDYDKQRLWLFLFAGSWTEYDNTHYGAAARIRYYLDGGVYARYPDSDIIKQYASYRKGNKRWRELKALEAA